MTGETKILQLLSQLRGQITLKNWINSNDAFVPENYHILIIRIMKTKKDISEFMQDVEDEDWKGLFLREMREAERTKEKEKEQEKEEEERKELTWIIEKEFSYDPREKNKTRKRIQKLK